MQQRPCALSIAGFDPSAGAGVLADVKTFEYNGVYGFGVVSALTYQNEAEFEKVEWLDTEKIIHQAEILLRRHSIRHIKIGLIRNAAVLGEIISFLKEKIEEPIIVFDPVMKASAGFAFHNDDDFLKAMKGTYCITPNIPEAVALFGGEDMYDKLSALSAYVNIYLKGGHGNGNVVTDILFAGKQAYTCSNTRLPRGEKHGSGCVLSSSLTAQLALGNDIVTAAESANRYTHQFLASSESLLGVHNTLQV